MDKSSLINTYKSELINIINALPEAPITSLVDSVLSAWENERTIFVCANGGSVGAVSNFVTDLNYHPFMSSDKTKPAGSRNKFKAVSLNSDISSITGIMNDQGSEFIYSKQLDYQSRQGDLLIAMSGSGNSSNIVEAIRTSKIRGMETFLITRNEKATGAIYADKTIFVGTGFTSKFPGQQGSNNNNFYFEDLLFSITHMVCGILKRKVGND